MDKSGSLKNYLNDICEGLNVCYENIYATNLIKYFYTDPPERTPQVMSAHLQDNLKLLLEEISQYHKIPIITLGLPVLQLLTNNSFQVKYFWGYDDKYKCKKNDFTFCKAKENKLGRDFFPFPHQPSISKEFYSNTFKSYLNYAKS